MSTNTNATNRSRAALMLGAGLVALSVVAAPLAASAKSAYDEDQSEIAWQKQVEQSRVAPKGDYVVTNNTHAYVPPAEPNAVDGPGPQG